MKRSLAFVLVLFCLLAGYGFWKANPRDPINAVIFTFGILGIILSVLRDKRN